MAQRNAIQPWLKDVHDALHGVVANISIRGKTREIVKAGKTCRLMKIGEFTFITQNPTKNSKWGQAARSGKKVTQIKLRTSWYGVIVDREVFKYGSEFGKQTLVGKI